MLRYDECDFNVLLNDSDEPTTLAIVQPNQKQQDFRQNNRILYVP